MGLEDEFEQELGTAQAILHCIDAAIQNQDYTPLYSAVATLLEGVHEGRPRYIPSYLRAIQAIIDVDTPAKQKGRVIMRHVKSSTENEGIGIFYRKDLLATIVHPPQAHPHTICSKELVDDEGLLIYMKLQHWS
jgi:hypothetical protein